MAAKKTDNWKLTKVVLVGVVLALAFVALALPGSLVLLWRRFFAEPEIREGVKKGVGAVVDLSDGSVTMSEADPSEGGNGR